MDGSNAVDAYLADLPEPHRQLLGRIRTLIHETQPGLAEVISYGMPAFEVRGEKLVWFASFKRHCSLFPASAWVKEVLGEALAPYLAEKSTIRFTAEHPLPDALVRRLVEVRAAEVGAR